MSFTDLVPDPGAVERIATGSTWAEGPCWIPASRTLRWSDIPGDRILQWHAGSGETSVYAEGVEFTNGRTLDRDGSVVQCSHGNRRVERDRDGVVTPIVDAWDGVRLNSPNDVVVARDGSVWFTDPAYGITQPREGHPGEREYGDHWVFRCGPDGADLRPVATDLDEPNGLAFDPTEQVLYVASSSGDDPVIRAYDRRGGRGDLLKNGRVFARLEPGEGAPDGIRVDVHGNVWSSSHRGVVVFDPDGTRLGDIAVPEVTANLCFGGDDGTTLFLAATTSVYRIATTTRDAAAE
ncbi:MULTISPECIES: SMP-30/gluconolactonase/LRE family protein [unclassified Curtobacterium]|uniref:SMP-30/gluconolactonase/LRE family protein n=1 Tax=unclassified Curtobacterium TaxID=257496 RepID=UPI0008DCDEAD|nr:MULTISPECIES: SMP-30/gluconolactonase/LRE family protein [unclassified Curtobacterium]MCT9620450.1 SMP-30/gluconolactonase/LRE family protein [Curtobacterium sp. C2H10]OII18109.1 gluconolactonase [Curtobacterium sp. MCBA15_016]